MREYAIGLSLFYILLFLELVLVQYFRYRRLRKYYGRQNADRFFYRDMRLRPFLPEQGSCRYEKTQTLLIDAGWRMPVEKFYICKYFLVFLVLLCGNLVIQTNIDIEKQAVMQNLNYKRSTTDYAVTETMERVEEERALIDGVQQYLQGLGLSCSDEMALPSVEAFLTDRELSYDSPNAAAKRMLLKLDRINELESDGKNFLTLFILAYLSFRALELLAYVKILLVYNKKDWEDLNCLAVYSILSRLPPFKIDTLISCMQSVCTVYMPLLGRFQEAVWRGDGREQERIIQAVQDDSMQEILETLALAQEIGIRETAENMDDILDTKLGYMEVTANKRRQVKVILAIIPVALILLFLFKYLMFGVVFIIQNSMIVL